jgi:hypothetical protein
VVADLLTFYVPEDVQYLTGQAERRTKEFFNRRRKAIIDWRLACYLRRHMHQ